MSKVSFAKKDAVSTGLNFGEGWGEIVEISAIVHQFPVAKKGPNAGFQSAPGTMVRVMLQRTDADGKHTTDDPVEQFFGCGGLDKIHPGIIENANDDSPEDQGDAIGAEGNCLFGVEGGKGLNTKSGWFIFTDHIESKRPDAGPMLEAGHLPDLVGLRAHFVTITLPKEKQTDNDRNVLVADKITFLPGVDKAAKKGATTKGTAAPAAKAAAAGASSNGGGATADDEVATMASRAFMAVAAKCAGQKIERGKLNGRLAQVLGVGLSKEEGPVPGTLHTPILKMFKDDEWFKGQCTDLDYAYDGTAISFPAN